jgi:hypothetical protein
MLEKALSTYWPHWILVMFKLKLCWKKLFPLIGHIGFLSCLNWSYVGKSSFHLLWPVLYSEETLRSVYWNCQTKYKKFGAQFLIDECRWLHENKVVFLKLWRFGICKMIPCRGSHESQRVTDWGNDLMPKWIAGVLASKGRWVKYWTWASHSQCKIEWINSIYFNSSFYLTNLFIVFQTLHQFEISFAVFQSTFTLCL